MWNLQENVELPMSDLYKTRNTFLSRLLMNSRLALRSSLQQPLKEISIILE